MAELTPTQKCQLEGIRKFIGGKKLFPLPSTFMETGLSLIEVKQFGVEGMQGAQVSTYAVPQGLVSSDISIPTSDGTKEFHVHDDHVGLHETTYFKTPAGGTDADTTHSRILHDGTSKPIRDAEPETYRPPGPEERKFHEDTKPTCETPAISSVRSPKSPSMSV